MPRRRTKKSLSKKRLTKQVRGRGKKSGRRRRSKSRSKRKNNLKGGANLTDILSNEKYFKPNSDGSSYTFADNLKKADVYVENSDQGISHDVESTQYKITQGNANTINLESTITLKKTHEKFGFTPLKDGEGNFRLYFFLPTDEVQGANTLQKVLISGGKIQELTIGDKQVINKGKFNEDEITYQGEILNGGDSIKYLNKQIKELKNGNISFTIYRDLIKYSINKKKSRFSF